MCWLLHGACAWKPRPLPLPGEFMVNAELSATSSFFCQKATVSSSLAVAALTLAKNALLKLTTGPPFIVRLMALSPALPVAPAASAVNTAEPNSRPGYPDTLSSVVPL